MIVQPTRRAVLGGLLTSPMLGRARAAERRGRWIAYYGSDAAPEAFDGFDLAVLDADEHPPLDRLASRGIKVLGYLSLGEAETYRPGFERHRAAGLLVEDNPLWSGHAIVDLRRPAWGEHVVGEAVPRILAQGFAGVMLDTVDSPLDLERREPERFGGMAGAALSLLRALKERHPGAMVMLNRGYGILPAAAPTIDAALAENLLTEWNPGEAKPRRVPESEVRQTLGRLAAARAARPDLPLYGLDYWPSRDRALVKDLYNRHRREGLIPYIGDIDLQSLRDDPE